MSIDSAVDLLFNIGANSDDAEENIARFRTLLGTDLEEISSQFADWSHELVGEINTVSAAMTAGAAVMGAGLVAVGGFLVEQTHKYEEYAEKIEQGVRVTGISAENMSKLAFAAQMTGTNYEALTKGLTFFEASVVKANSGSEQQVNAFKSLGISTEELKAGETDIMPLLEKVMDRFKGLSSGAEKAALARELFSRGGAALQKMLAMGSEGLREMAAEAQRLGMVLSGKDLSALEAHKAAVEELKMEASAFAIEIGQHVLPILTAFTTALIGLVEAVKDGALSDGFAGFFAKWGIETEAAQDRMERLVKTMEAEGRAQLDLADKAKEATGDFGGLSAALETINQRMAAGAGEMGKAAEEVNHLDVEIAKATHEYQKLANAGKLTGEATEREAAALALLPRRMAQLWEQLSREANTKIAEEVTQFGSELEGRIAAQGQQTLAIQEANFTREIAGLRAQLAKKKDLTVEQYEALNAEIDELQKAGDEKLGRDKAEAIAAAGADIQRRIEALSEKSYTQQVAAANREMGALIVQYAKKENFVRENESLIEQLRKATIDKIERDQTAAYIREISGLQAHLGTMLNAEATRVTKLADQYNKDLRAFSQAEEAKVLLTAKSESERSAIETQFAALRTALLDKYALDLQGLQNSQGWQGIFGSKFASGLKNNEDLMKQWATSSNQSLMLVKVSLENLKEMGQHAFEQMAQGMGAGIANALVYSKSVGAAMEAVLKSTLESLAAQAFTQAIYSTALGFMDLAQDNPVGAAAAFEAAAMFGLVGAAAGIAGRAIPGGGGGSGGGSGSSGSSGSGSSDKGAATGFTTAPTTNAGPHVVVNVAGHVFGVSGVQELASAINDAVLNRDVTLTATNTKTGQVVTQ
jgi:hypothetical protein